MMTESLPHSRPAVKSLVVLFVIRGLDPRIWCRLREMPGPSANADIRPLGPGMTTDWGHQG
jgi:hypothetical protein